ncbi:hypothetical protein CIW83_00250 [Tissierella sp. P1]|jgi:DNA-binding GntR family transcriptional regulator|uniref:GntR family transcriptional regulator n=1 Tax=Tissierella TaxID=41273 RepID=UPI000B9FE47E|nr:GntR family transcriptional regulator [Tissierella sp. P1]OZV13909.1 hypothetical protein CIW83_00250 [Tissierella sp. P1]
MRQLPQIKSKGTLAERTYDILKNAIVELELKPGELITEEDISEQLGVSRTPIRSALNRLLHEELIEMIPGKGTFVAQLTKKQIDDLLSIRELLESLSIQLAATLRTQEDLEKIEYILYKQEQSFTGQFKSQQDFLTFDSEFHCLIAEISQNKYLEKQLLQILNNCRRYLNATTIDIIMPDVLKEHKELYEQIKNQDVEKAKLCMQKHIDNIRTRMIENLNYDDIK